MNVLGVLLELMQRLHHSFIVKVAVKIPVEQKLKRAVRDGSGLELEQVDAAHRKAGKGVVQGACAVLHPHNQADALTVGMVQRLFCQDDKAGEVVAAVLDALPAIILSTNSPNPYIRAH